MNAVAESRSVGAPTAESSEHIPVTANGHRVPCPIFQCPDGSTSAKICVYRLRNLVVTSRRESARRAHVTALSAAWCQ